MLHNAIRQPYDIVAGLLTATTLVVAVVYSPDALYGERRVAAFCSGSRYLM